MLSTKAMVIRPTDTLLPEPIEVFFQTKAKSFAGLKYDESKNEILRLLGMPRGDWFEHVSVLYHGERLDMFVDEHGRMKGLEMNPVATRIYLQASCGNDRAKMLEAIRGGSFIVGTAVLFLNRIWY